jgi:hypothetical protein
MNKENAQGKKHDVNKPRYSLLPWEALAEIVQVLEFGAAKYGVDNWRKVPNAQQRYFDALVRHIVAWRSGEADDPESGLPHLAHAGCCVLFLLALELDDPTGADEANEIQDELDERQLRIDRLETRIAIARERMAAILQREGVESSRIEDAIKQVLP